MTEAGQHSGGSRAKPWSPKALRDQFPILERQVNGWPLHYLDNAATTFMPTAVQERMAQFENHSRANVQRGIYQMGVEASEATEAARGRIAHYLNASSSEEIIFTSGTTHAVNTVAQGLGELFQAGDEVVVSLAEHHSNFVPWQRLCQQQGLVLKVIPVTANGTLDLSQLDALISDRCRLVAVTQVSNVTGCTTDLAPIVALAHKQGALVFVDGAQAAPRGPQDVQTLGVDFYAFSGHKCYGPTGVGVLWGRQQLLAKLAPLMTGGGMIERVSLTETRYAQGHQRFEAGTPPITQVIGLAAALDWLAALPWDEINRYERRLQRQLQQGLLAIPGLTLLGDHSVAANAPIFSFELAACHPHDICQILDEYGLALRGGHHCAQPLMDALGLVATTRASLAVFNTSEDVAALLQGLDKVVEVLR